MGLLDDAIREHLDLKRRRGADPAEVERDEQEALGPVRRNRDTAGTLVPDTGDLADSAWDEPGTGDLGNPAWKEPDGGVAADLVQERPAFDDAPPTEIAQAADDRFRGDHPDFPPPLELTAADDDSNVRDTAQEPSPGAALSDQTAEYTLDEARSAENADEDEDVLQETPEFLQDTPDHDRLWFEQRPPRDFDFDG